MIKLQNFNELERLTSMGYEQVYAMRNNRICKKISDNRAKKRLQEAYDECPDRFHIQNDTYLWDAPTTLYGIEMDYDGVCSILELQKIQCFDELHQAYLYKNQHGNNIIILYDDVIYNDQQSADRTLWGKGYYLFTQRKMAEKYFIEYSMNIKNIF